MCRCRDRFAFLPFGAKIKVLPPSSWRQATAHRAVAFGWVRSRHGNKKRDTPVGGIPFLGAGDRDRTGTLFTARDFKSLVSAYSTTPAALTDNSIFFPCRQGASRGKPGMDPENYIWSRFNVKGTRHSFKNQSSSGSFMASKALRVCQAAESNSVLPAFCSSRHLM